MAGEIGAVEFWTQFMQWAVLIGLLGVCLIGWLVWRTTKAVEAIDEKLEQQITDLSDRVDLELEIVERELRNLKGEIKAVRQELPCPVDRSPAANLPMQTKKVAADPLEPLVRAMRAEGLSLRGIAQRLNEGGVATPRGGKWSASSVQRLVKRLGL